jgi:hypothetical protein
MAFWSAYVRSQCRIATTVYLDDRTLWDTGNSAKHMSRALVASDTIDARFGFRLNFDKCQAAATTKALRCLLEKLSLGYGPIKAELHTLGLRYDLTKRGMATLLRADIQRAHARLTRISAVSRLLWRRRMFARTMVLPIWTWAAGFARVGRCTLMTLRRQIMSSIYRFRPRSAALPLLQEVVLTSDVDPTFALDWAILRQLHQHVRDSYRVAAWHDCLDVAFIAASPQAWMPELDLLLRRLQWSWIPRRCTLERVDLQGVRRAIRLDWDGLGVLHQWLLHFWRVEQLAMCRRVQRSGHRGAVSDLAVGLDLPAPCVGHALLADSHVANFTISGDSVLCNLALATGLSCWHCAAGLPTVIQAGGERSRCLCGRRDPSLPHLLWNCTATSALRLSYALRLPRDRAEERLLCSTCGEQPAPVGSNLAWHLDLAAWSLDAPLLQLCRAALRRSQPAAATDGGASHGVAVWAIHIPEEGSVTGIVMGEDTGAFASELEALVRLLTALAETIRRQPELLRPCGPPFLVIFDCQSAGNLLSALGVPTERFAQWAAVRRADAQCQRAGLRLAWHWVPAHHRPRKGWLPPFGVTEAEVRNWNDVAHRAASEALQLALVDSERVRWSKERESLLVWSMTTLKYAGEVHTLYKQHLASLEDDLPLVDLAGQVGDQVPCRWRRGDGVPQYAAILST